MPQGAAREKGGNALEAEPAAKEGRRRRSKAGCGGLRRTNAGREGKRIAEATEGLRARRAPPASESSIWVRRRPAPAVPA